MTFITMPQPSDLRRIAGSVILLLAGVLFGLISVYSNTRAGCAFWVTFALAVTFVSGVLAAQVRTRAVARTSRV